MNAVPEITTLAGSSREELAAPSCILHADRAGVAQTLVARNPEVDSYVSSSDAPAF